MQSVADKTFPAIRWVNILLRTAHLVGVAGVGGAFLYQVPPSAWKPYLALIIVSGTAMLLLDIWSNARCLLQVRGIATLVKILLLSISAVAGMQAHILIAVIVISGVISHAPAKVRYLSLVKVSAVKGG